MADFETLLAIEFAGNLVRDYLISLCIFVVSWIILKFFKHFVLVYLHNLAKRTSTELDDVVVGAINSIGAPFYSILSLYVALQFIQVPGILYQLLLFAFIIVSTYYAVRTVQSLVDYIAKKLIEERQKTNAYEDTSVIELLANIVKFGLWIIAILLIISNLGYDITPMIAGLGIGGIAVAFALQNVLSDIFASFSIYFDKPFQIGDTIQIGTDIGTVKRIGIKSTRLQTLQGQELIVSNKELTESRVHNHKRMQKRRISFGFGVTYDTPIEKVRKIPDILTEIIKKAKLADLDRVHFKELGQSSLNFEIVYYIKTSNYLDYMNTQQEINLALMEAFEKEKIEFAYPTQTLHLYKAK